MSSAGATGRWRCAGAPRAWSRPAPSSAGSTGICTFGRYAPPWNATPPTLSDPTATVTPKPPPEHRTAAEVPRRAGQPPDPDWGVMVWLIMTTGARRGEICSLRWSRLDLDRAVVIFKRSTGQIGRDVWEKDTKTH